MKTRTLLVTIVLTGTLVGHAGAAGPNQSQCPVTGSAVAELTETEAQNITYMRLEEKLARDVYLTLAELYDCPVFTNIAAAEQRHMDAVGLLITKYGLEDPIVDDTVGAFADLESVETDFAAAFVELTEKGAASLLEALAVGVYIEETDIADLERALDATDKADLEWVFENLLRGSNNHLRAFTRAIATDGTSCSSLGRRVRANDADGNADRLSRRGRGRGGRGNGRGDGNGNGACDGTGRADGHPRRDGSGQADQRRSRDGSCDAEPDA